MSSNSSIEVRVSLLERGFDGLSSLLDKFDVTNEKLSDVTYSIKQLLAVHEVQLRKHDEADEEIYKLMEARRDEMMMMNKVQNEKFQTLQSELNRKIDETERELLKELVAIKNDMTKRHDDNDKRAHQLERWKWIAVGAIGLAFFLASKTNIFSFFTSMI